MFIATLLKPRPQAATTSSSSPARQSRMFQRRATRHLHSGSSFPATQHIDADFMTDDEIIPVAPAIADINVVGVAHDMPSRQDCTRPADIGPKGFVDSAIAAPVESVAAVPGMAPACADAASIEVAPTLTPVEETTTTLPTMTADADSEVQVTETITAAPSISAAAPADAGTVPTGAPPSTLRKGKNPSRKTENVGLGSDAGKTKRPRRKSAKESGASGAADLAASDERLPGYDLGVTSGAHSPP